ncbi:PTS sugar transporter subunit IIC [Aporhodopirellula aestuarii]|uniref:Uncharacterized protein n=1 Tax=Aporhodopirellula aestuarii TaxID=2950107 RepID=A0ABT0U5A2_9BACT|nr:hypothetical protein [Aporhodopirellula aestuarii]MCM2371531.1 hypothetical protein [Aporhodopirellula aestuarii]
MFDPYPTHRTGDHSKPFNDEFENLFGDESLGPDSINMSLHGDSDLEDLIRGAGNYVRPGDQLRARILESVAHRRERRYMWQRFFGGFALATTVVLALVIIGQIGLAIAPRGRTASDLQRQAARRANADGVAWEWALTEVVYDWRRSTTGRLDNPSVPSKPFTPLSTQTQGDAR